MKKILLGLMLAVVSVSAAANWIFIGETDEFNISVNAETLRKAGSKTKMWDLKGYKTAQDGLTPGIYYWSAKRQYEYDCEEEQNRLLAISLYSEPNGNGKVVYSHSRASDWSPVVPDSVGHTLWALACGKKL